jgi:hypothetical protein
MLAVQDRRAGLLPAPRASWAERSRSLLFHESRRPAP